MKKILCVALVLGALQQTAFGQLTNCTQVLRLAQSTYEQGRLHELPTLMDDCLKKPEGSGGFTKQQRVDAYRYLTLAYIYLEEPEKADEAMLNLLRTDHYFQLNENVDPAEFIGLYNTFRTKPVYSIGAKFGVNGTFPIVSSNYYVGNTAVGKGKYASKVAFQAGIVFEKNFFENSKNKTLKRITFAPEVLYTIRNLTYSNPAVFTADGSSNSVAAQQGDLKQTWLDLNLLFQYQLKGSALNPYIGFGPGVSYLLSAPNSMTLTRANSIGTVSGPAVEMKLTYQKLVPSLLAVAGIKYQFGSIKLTAEARLQYGLTNVINTSTRSDAESVFDYAFVPSNIQQFNAMVNLGFVFPYFNPIKKIHK